MKTIINFIIQLPENIDIVELELEQPIILPRIGEKVTASPLVATAAEREKLTKPLFVVDIIHTLNKKEHHIDIHLSEEWKDYMNDFYLHLAGDI